MDGGAEQPLPSRARRPRGSSTPRSTPTFLVMTPLRSALTIAVLLGATACGNAAAAPRVTAPSVPPAASVALVQRLDEGAAAALADVSGLHVAAAQQQLAGLQVTVVGFGDKSDTVSAQWPAAGDRRPADGVVVVWVGEPAQPPKPRREPAPSPASLPTGPSPALPGSAPAPQPVATAPAPVAATPRAGGPGSGVTPGLESFVAPPHAPRANIRTLPAAASGTALAGRASWYGPGFEGRGTACGTIFDPSQPTLASRELRCGTKVTVTGPAGSVEATVTDWGPAEWTNRRFDLSQATFAAVAPLGSGVVDVTVEVR